MKTGRGSWLSNREKQRAQSEERKESGKQEDNYGGNTKLFFEKANEIKNGFKPRSTIMRGEDGSLITEVTSEFKDIFERMLM